MVPDRVTALDASEWFSALEPNIYADETIVRFCDRKIFGKFCVVGRNVDTLKDRNFVGGFSLREDK